MSKITSATWHGCPFRYAATVIGDPWSQLILRDLVFREACNFGDFVAGGEGISTNILTDRLRRLEAEGVVHRAPDPENAVKVIYGLTDKGRDLVPVLLSMIRWSAQWDPQTEVPGDFSAALAEDPAGMAAALIDGLTPEASI